MKIGQVIEYNMRNVFLEKSYATCGGENIPRLFFKKQNWAYLWINSLKFYSLFWLYAKLTAIDVF